MTGEGVDLHSFSWLPVVLVLVLTGCAAQQKGTVELTVHDSSAGMPTPARVELLGWDGAPHVPDEALEVFGDCRRFPIHNWVPSASQAQLLRGRHRAVENPFIGTTQFYVDGPITMDLEPGHYRVAATKGIEYEIARAEFTVVVGQTERVRLDLVRWVNLPAEGWYGADDHLHIPRPHPRFDERIATWMQAEDLHVANMLQMGLAQDVQITPQHGFGPGLAHRQGDTLVVSGQENPRTHVLGHSIVLGADRWIDFPDEYMLYDRVWDEAHERGGINGYAHWGLAGAEEGLAVWGHLELLDFIEVLNLGFPLYQRWYEALDLGIRISPTAGTDYPCLPSLPGRERFYTQVDGPLRYDTWLDAVRRGRTFVTNGPVIELAIAGVGVGDEITLTGPRPVRGVGRVRFDPERDVINRLELVQGGAVVQVEETPFGPGELRINTRLSVEQSTWVALRARGWKVGETKIEAATLLRSFIALERRTNEELTSELPEGPVRRPSAAHTAAIYITVEGTPAIAEQPRADEVAEAWLARLDELEARFADDQIDRVAGFPGRGDGIARSNLEANREALLRAIESARRHYLP